MKLTGFKIKILAATLMLSACTPSGPLRFLSKSSPHEVYRQKLVTAGLNESKLGQLWIVAAEESLDKALNVPIPFKETGYFPTDKPRASTLSFDVKRGEKITVNLHKRPESGFNIFVDLWRIKEGKKKLITFTETDSSSFNHVIDDAGRYLLRIQPELLSGGEYTLTIATGPSLAFPVKNGTIGSFWGADRDGGARKHEGVDIFAKKRAPALAAAEGVISRVTVNELGGKVIFLNVAKQNISLYYAHLDEQLLKAGTRVKPGDTIGLIGNTGNALSTSPHLHFGIYTFGGAIDPFPFINPKRTPAPAIMAPTANLGRMMRTNFRETELISLSSAPQKTQILPANTIVEVLAANTNKYTVRLPDGTTGFVRHTQLSSGIIERMKTDQEMALLDNPFPGAARKTVLNSGASVDVIGRFKGFAFVKAQDDIGWIEAR